MQSKYSNILIVLVMLSVLSCSSESAPTPPPSGSANAPTVSNTTQSVDEDAELIFSLVGSDLDGDALTYTITQHPLNGIVNVVGNQATYQPYANFNGSDSFQFVANDGFSQSNVGIVNITVYPLNDAPVIVGDITYYLNEDGTIAIDLSASDAEGDVFTFILGTPSNGALTGTGSTYVYTPNTNWNGMDSFTYYADDGQAENNLSGMGTISLNVAAVNDVPVVTDLAYAVITDEDTAVALSLVGFTVDMDTAANDLIYQVASQPASGGSVTCAANGDCSFTPGTNWNGTTSFTYKVQDTNGAFSNTATVNVIVNAVNDAPVAADFTKNHYEDYQQSFTLSATDVDAGDNLINWTLVTQPVNGAITGTLPSLTYTPNANWSGTETFSFTVQDSSGATSNVATVTLNLAAVNDTPVAASITGLATDEDTPLSAIQLSATDVDNTAGELSYEISYNSNGNTICDSQLPPVCTFTPNVNFNGTAYFYYRVSDGSATSANKPVSITVSPVNDLPQFSDAPNTALNTDVYFNYTPTISDPDGPSKVFQLTNAPAWLALNASTGRLSGTPDNEMAGSYPGILLQVSDDAGTTWVDLSFDLTVADTTPPPEVASFNVGVRSLDSNLTWLNPVITTVDGSDFTGVKIMRGEGSCPADATSGVQVFDGTVEGIIDSGLVLGTEYCYIAFTYDDETPANFSAGVPMTVTAVPSLYYSGSTWNDWVIKDGASFGSHSDAACGSYVSPDGCIHGGEIRSFPVTGQASCTGLSAADDLSAFEWVCDSTTSPVQMISSGLKDGKHLSDLIDLNTLSWKLNVLRVTDTGSTEVYTSPSVAWWYNPVLDGNGVSPLSQTGAIYVVTTNDGVKSFGAQKIGLIVQDGFTVTATGTYISSPAVYMGYPYLWVEGSFDANGMRSAINMKSGHTVARNVTVTGATTQPGQYAGEGAGGVYVHAGYNRIEYVKASGNLYGLYVDRSTGASFANIETEHNTYGAYSWNSEKNNWDNIHASKNSIEGIWFQWGSGLLTNVISANNNGNGLRLGARGLTVMNVSASNNAGNGIIFDGQYNNSLSNVALSNNGLDGLLLYGDVWNNFMSNITSVNNASDGMAVSTNTTGGDTFALSFYNGIMLGNGANGLLQDNSGTAYYENLILANNTVGLKDAVSVTPSYNGLVKIGNNTTDCLTSIVVDCSVIMPGTYSLVAGVDGQATVVGKVSSDTINTDGASGVLAYDSIVDWTHFENGFRGWGLDGVLAFPDVSNQGRCTTGVDCRIWDLSYSALDLGDPGLDGILGNGDDVPLALDVSTAIPTGDDTRTHKWFARDTVDVSFSPNDQADCDYYKRGSVFDGINACINTFLIDAIEIANDAIGNDNGLCESGETCLYTPNIGAYQGHGNLISAGAFTDSTIGGITGVTLLKYSNNGY